MISLRNIFFCALVTAFSAAAHAQYISIDENFTTQQLVEDVLINNSCANVSNIVVTAANLNGANSFAYFSGAGTTFPFAEGIILSTGSAASAIGPNNSLLSEGPASWAGDSDLEQALGVNNSINATALEFDFLPLANKISFDYIFSSEQYLSSPSANQCNYTDGFVFLLKKANTAEPYQNLAVVPNTNIPVKVNTVRGPGTICPAANEEYFDAFNDVEHPTNYNGQTIVLTASANVTPNTLYHIKLVVADQGNNLYDSAIFLGGGSFRVEKDLGPDRLLASNNALCTGETLILDATEAGTNTYQWFNTTGAIPGATNPTYTVTDAGIYSVEITLNSTTCIATGEITIEYATPLNVTSPVTLVQCDTDNNGISTFNLTILNNQISAGNTITYYESLTNAQNNSNAIANPGNYQNTVTNTLYARVSNGGNCDGYATVQLEINNEPVYNEPLLETCDLDPDPVQDGFYFFNLHDADPQVLDELPSGLIVEYYETTSDALVQTNPLPNVFYNTVQNDQIIYARIINGSDCYGIIPIVLVVNTHSPDNFQEDTVGICLGSPKTLSVDPIFYSYLWSNGDADNATDVTTPGTYTVTVSDENGCLATKTFIVAATEPATFGSAEINDFSGDQNSILIHYSGNGNYTFSIDGTNFQESPLFIGLDPGEYTIFIREEDCGTIGPFRVTILDYPRFFTPNGDGYNDIWQIPMLDTQPNSTLSIFNRYGKLLYNGKGNGYWDGKSNSENLPATDYWFVLRFENGRTVKGHFSLKR